MRRLLLIMCVLAFPVLGGWVGYLAGPRLAAISYATNRLKPPDARFAVPGAALGVCCGLLIGLKLLAAVRIVRRADYEADRGRCLACGRCYMFCPRERKRLGAVGPAKADLDGSRRSVEHERKAALGVLIIAALFGAVVATAMIHRFVARDRSKPPVDASLRSLRGQVTPGGTTQAKTVEAIRDRDLAVRTSYFAQRRFYEDGARLLLAGVVVVLASAKYLKLIRPELPRARSITVSEALDEDLLERRTKGMAAGLMGAGVLCAGGLYLAYPWIERQIPAPMHTSSVYRENWPRFRGAVGGGLAAESRRWGDPRHLQVKWKIDVPWPGHSSPIVWGDWLFVTGGNESELHVMCFARDDGRLVWDSKVQRPPWAAVEGSTRVESDFSVPDDTGYAAPTPVTDGRYVFATFATADVVCFDFKGRQVWARNFGVPDSVFGLASSLVMHGDTLIYQLDQGANADEGKSRLYGLDPRTGAIVWRAIRPVQASWTSPIIAEAAGRAQVITVATPYVIAYAPASGHEMWRCSGVEGDVAPSPIFTGGLVFAMNENASLLAIRPDGQGDITTTNKLVWTAKGGLPDTVSPLSDGVLLLIVSSGGTLSMFDAKTGERAWQQKLEGEFQSSPTLIGGLVYLIARDGRLRVFEMARAYREVASFRMEEAVSATPAACDGAVYVRGVRSLICLGYGDAGQR